MPEYSNFRRRGERLLRSHLDIRNALLSRTGTSEVLELSTGTSEVLELTTKITCLLM
jgi:hypothetical protein